MTQFRHKAATQRAQVFHIDEYPICRFGLSQLLTKEPDLALCGSAIELAPTLDEFKVTTPDLVVIEISTNRGRGLDWIKQINVTHPAITILVYSIEDERYYAMRALRAGAMGYVSKEEPLEVLMTAIRTVLDNRIFLSDHIKDRVLTRHVGRAEPVSGIDRLTDRELQVFTLTGHGRNTREISSSLNLSPKTVETYYDRIKKKLALPSYHAVVTYSVRWIEGSN